MDIARHWRLKDQRYGLTGSVCTNCGKRFFAPRPVCDECGTVEEDAYRFNGHRAHHQPMQIVEPAQR